MKKKKGKRTVAFLSLSLYPDEFTRRNGEEDENPRMNQHHLHKDDRREKRNRFLSPVLPW